MNMNMNPTLVPTSKSSQKSVSKDAKGLPITKLKTIEGSVEGRNTGPRAIGTEDSFKLVKESMSNGGSTELNMPHFTMTPEFAEIAGYEALAEQMMEKGG